MNKYLSAGLKPEQRSELMFQSFQERPVTEQPIQGALLNELIAAHGSVKASGVVSRQLMRGVSPFISAAKDVNLNLWTEEPSGTSLDKAITLLEAGITETKHDALAKLFAYCIDTLKGNADTFDNLGLELKETIQRALEKCSTGAGYVEVIGQENCASEMNEMLKQMIWREGVQSQDLLKTQTDYIRYLVENPDKITAVNVGAIATLYVHLMDTLDKVTKTPNGEFDVEQWSAEAKIHHDNASLLAYPGFSELPYNLSDVTPDRYLQDIVAAQSPVEVKYDVDNLLGHFKQFNGNTGPGVFESALRGADAFIGVATTTRNAISNIDAIAGHIVGMVKASTHQDATTQAIGFLKLVSELVKRTDTFAKAFMFLTQNVIDYSNAINEFILRAAENHDKHQHDVDVTVAVDEREQLKAWLPEGEEDYEAAVFARSHSEVEAADGFVRDNFDTAVTMEGFKDIFTGAAEKLKRIIKGDDKGPNAKRDTKSAFALRTWLKNNKDEILKTYGNKAWVERNVHGKPIANKAVLQALSLDGKLVGTPEQTLIKAGQIFTKDFFAVIKLVDNRRTRIQAALIEACSALKKADADHQAIAESLVKTLEKIPAVPKLSYPKDFETPFGTKASSAEELPAVTTDQVVSAGQYLAKTVLDQIEGVSNSNWTAGIDFQEGDIWELLDENKVDEDLYDRFVDAVYFQREENDGASTGLYDHTVAWYDTVIAVVDWLARSTSERELNMQSFQEEQLVMLDAWEVTRKGLERTLQILKALIDWVLKSWKVGSAIGSVKRAEANGPLLSAAKDAVITDAVTKRFEKLQSGGLDLIVKHSGVNVFYKSYKAVVDSVPALMLNIETLYKQASRGESHQESAIDEIDDALTNLLKKSHFAELANTEETVTLQNCSQLVAGGNTAARTAFKTAGQLKVTVDDLIKGNDGCKDFLKGVVNDTRLKISGHELDGALNTLSSIVRLQAKNPNNPILAQLKDRVVLLRNVIQATLETLGILSTLERGAKVYVAALGDLVQSWKPDEVNQQDYRYIDEFGRSPCDAYQDCSWALNRSTFTEERERLLRGYVNSIQEGIESIRNCAELRRGLQFSLVGRIDPADETVVSTTYSGRLAGNLVEFRLQLVKAYNLYRESYREDLSDACVALSIKKTLGDYFVSGSDMNDVATYRRIVGMSTEECKQDIYPGFKVGGIMSIGVGYGDKEDEQDGDGFLPGRPLMEGQKIDGRELRNIKTFAVLFLAAVSAYVALEYSIDSIIYRSVSSGIAPEVNPEPPEDSDD